MKLSTFSRALPLVVLAPFVALSSATDDGGQKLFPHGGTPPENSNRFFVEYDNDDARRAAKNQADRVFFEFPSRKTVVVEVKNPQALIAIANTPGVKSIEEDALRYVSGVSSVRGRGGTRPSSLESFAEDLLKSTGSSNNSEKNEPRDLKATSQQQAHRKLAQVTPYGISMVQADQVSDANAANTMVCIIDSGYNAGHEDLGAATGSNDSGSGAWDDDTCSHGTHVAGTIAATNNNVGVVGVAPNGNLKLHIIKVFDGTGCGWAYSSNLVKALDDCKMAAAAAGKKLVVSMSLGGSRSVRTEENAFNSAHAAGVLSIAAAGNDGNTRHSYPASYDGVVSVAALDSAAVIADFSQQTDQVELAAPGVAVRSAVRSGAGFDESVSVGGNGFEVTAMEFSPNGSRSGNLYRCNAVDGLGSPGDCAGASGQVCLISRGAISFADKVQECEAQGGVGAIIFNNANALFSGTLGGAVANIPSIGMSGTDGATLEGMIGQTATVTTMGGGNYAFYDGTSMATPHVSGVAALVWSHHPTCSASEIRDALATTAVDLGAAGRDNAYGWGLVQAKGAKDYLDANGCAGTGGGGGGCNLLPPGDSCTDNSECCSGSCKGQPGNKTCK